MNKDVIHSTMVIRSQTETIKLLEEENQKLKEDIAFCLKSIKQEMEMSTDSRTRQEMKNCYEILKDV